jgi:hypothetical protein
LNTTPEEILATVRRGWLPEQIEGVSSKYALEGHPPPLESVPEWIDPMIAKQCKARVKSGPTALGLPQGKGSCRIGPKAVRVITRIHRLMATLDHPCPCREIGLPVR